MMQVTKRPSRYLWRGGVDDFGFVNDARGVGNAGKFAPQKIIGLAVGHGEKFVTPNTHTVGGNHWSVSLKFHGKKAGQPRRTAPLGGVGVKLRAKPSAIRR